MAVRGPRDRGQHTSAPYSPRAGAARHSQSASSAHSGAGRRAGIFSVASSAASACADPHEEGVPTEDPPLSSFLLLLLRLTASSCAPKLRRKCPHCPHPKSAAPGPPPQPPPEVWLKLSRLCSEAASCVLPPQPPPPTANPAPLSPRPGPAAFGTQGFPAGRSAGPSCARRDLLRVLRLPLQAFSSPRLISTRLNSVGAGLPRWAGPLSKEVGDRTLNFRL